MKTAGKRKITHGYVEQVFDDDNKCIKQEFVAGDHVNWENEHGEEIVPSERLENEYHPFDMVQPVGMAIALTGNISEGYGAVGPFPTFDDACAWADCVESWIMTLQNPYEEFDDARHPRGFGDRGETVGDRYIRDGGNCCPYCGSVDLHCGEVDEQLSAMYRPIRCEGCRKEWTETFTMTNVSLME